MTHKRRMPPKVALGLAAVACAVAWCLWPRHGLHRVVARPGSAIRAVTAPVSSGAEATTDPTSTAACLAGLYHLGLTGGPADLPELGRYVRSEQTYVAAAAILSVARIGARVPENERAPVVATVEELARLVAPRELDGRDVGHLKALVAYARWRVNRAGQVLHAGDLRALLKELDVTPARLALAMDVVRRRPGIDVDIHNAVGAGALLVECAVPFVAAGQLAPDARDFLDDLGVSAMPIARARLDLARLPDERARVEFAVARVTEGSLLDEYKERIIQELADRGCGGRRADLVALLESSPPIASTAQVGPEYFVVNALLYLAAADGDAAWLPGVMRYKGANFSIRSCAGLAERAIKQGELLVLAWQP